MVPEYRAFSIFAFMLMAFIGCFSSPVNSKPSCPGHASCGGDGDSGDSDNAFDATACAGATGAFPAFAFNREVHAKNGRLDAAQIQLTDADASPAALGRNHRFAHRR